MSFRIEIFKKQFVCLLFSVRRHINLRFSLFTRITSSEMPANFIRFLLSSSATGEFYLKICVTSYSRQIVSDFLKVVCAINGHAKTVFEEMKSFLLLCMSLVVDFVFLGGTNSVMVISVLILYSVFRQILLRKTVNTFCNASFTQRYKFSCRALARQSRFSVIPYQEEFLISLLFTYSNLNTNGKFDLFYNQIDSVCKIHVPYKRLFKREVEISSKPWITN